MNVLSAYALLFASAFFSATLLPGSSEAALLGFLAAGERSAAVLIAVATVGNVAGSALNWLLGRFLMRYRDRRWFPVDERFYERAADWYRRYGMWSLLLAWLPFIGDALTLAAGVLRADLRWFVPLVAIGKLGRYLFVAGAFTWWTN